MNSPDNLKYTKTHEWVLIDGDMATVGLTDYAQSELGDIVFVELAAAGTKVAAEAPFGTIEAVKAVSDLYAPVSGEVTETNSALSTSPDLVNKDCYGKGWMVKMKMSNPAEAGGLLSAADYEKVAGQH
jgi:glycine cleavage system H protein